MSDNSGMKAMYTCDDYCEIFHCGKAKARRLMEQAGIVRVGKVPMVPAERHEKFMAKGRFEVSWPAHPKCYTRLIEARNERPDTDDHSAASE